MATKTTSSLDATAQPVAPAPAAPSAAPVHGFSITALVLGITGIALGQWLLSVAAIVFGFVARSKEPPARLMANWGLVLGFVGTFGWLVLGIMGVAFFAPLAIWGVFAPWDLANIGAWDIWNR
jgi:hypothetical protein